MTQRYKKLSESFGFLEKLYVPCYMKKLKTLSIYSFMMLFPDEASALRYIEKTLWGDLPNMSLLPWYEYDKKTFKKRAFL